MLVEGRGRRNLFDVQGLVVAALHQEGQGIIQVSMPHGVYSALAKFSVSICSNASWVQPRPYILGTVSAEQNLVRSGGLC